MDYNLKRGTELATIMLLSAGIANAQELSVLIDNNPDTVAITEALTAAYSAANPDVTFEIELRPGGGEGDNLVKTRLATGEMADIFAYNSGSLFQALNPTRTLEPIDDLPNLGNIISSFTSTVKGTDGSIYGVPHKTAMGGGIFYNIPVYEKLGLSVPTTWDAFMANNAAIKAAGEVAPVAQTYRDSWTSQLFVLADYYNVQAQVPDFAEKYTGNEAKYATTPAAMAGFQHLQDVYEAGYLNVDFGAATYDDGLRMVATGEAAHYPMLTFAVGAIQQNHPDQLGDVGFFAQPGDSADDNGLTVWMPNGYFIPKGSDYTDIAKDFLNFIATTQACDVITAAVGATGPYLIQGCSLPSDVPTAVSDMLPYFQEGGKTAPALEFLSPVKGPALEQITVEAGSGIREAAAAAALYDKDVEKQAKQLGLPNW